MSYDRLLEGLKRDVERLKTGGTGEDEDFDLSDPVTFVEKYVAHPKGKSQSEWFKDREWLLPIYRDESKNIIFEKARQMEITEYFVNMLLYWGLKHPGMYIYATSSLPKASIFSRYRLIKQIEASPKLKPLLGRKQTHTVEYGRSVFIIYSAFGDARTLRSLSAEGLMLDEFQDQEADALGIAQQVLTHGELKRTWIAGNPLLTGSRYEEYFNDSTKLEWDKASKVWIPHTIKSNPTFSGYHISQEMAVHHLSPIANESNADYLIRMKAKMPKQQYVNEVLGQFFSGLGRPLKYGDIYNLFSPALEKNGYKKTDSLFAGVDWGIGRTARTVFWLVRPQWLAQPDIFGFDTLYVERIESVDLDYHLKRVGELIKEHTPRAVACDIGAGSMQNQYLFKDFGDRVMSVEFSPRSLQAPLEIVPSAFGNIIRANRTWALDNTFDTLMKPNRSRFYNEPDEAFKEYIIGDILAEYPEVSEQTGKRMWTHDPDTTDDALMAYTYSLLAFEVFRKNYIQGNPEDYIQFI